MSSSDDAAVWRSVGHDLIQSFVSVTVETFIIAIYSVLIFKTGHLLLRKNRTKVSLYTCLAVFTMYGLALALWMIDIHNVITEIQMTLLSTSTDSLDDIYFAAVSRILRLASVEDVLYAYMTIIGDGVIIWRVYAFWSNGRERLVLLIPLAFLVGSISSSIMLTYCAARLGADIKLGTYQHPAFCRNIQTASYSTTLATTAVATILIAYKTWKYRRTHTDAFGKLSSQTPAQRIMFMLIESGVLYMLFFLVQVIMSLGSVNASINKNAGLTFALTVYEYISSLVVGIYPTVVVILVNSERSVLKLGSKLGSGVGSPGSTLVHKRSQGTNAGEGTYTSASSTGPGRAPVKTIDLYEMARLRDGEEADSDAKDRSTSIRV